ncbi:Demethylsterigmatocystin 6-O-methyltransferase 10 [Colletotrichum chlorophyti]|uniref:Demethylsterigmatocystin 6-O-methyltransferase 10 n=1 Tax=Colletotrichum chlorophyti TaxID=708187 RepID=A0A1Q8RDB4_9PEZI|nr:Demethylsterigmatocystin 6-O-methyltransferase 10 [Colletotrichum chlorophyti]
MGDQVGDEVQAEAAAAAEEVNAALDIFLKGSSPRGGDLDQTRRRLIIDAANNLIAAVKDPADEWFDAAAQVALWGANRLFWEWKAYDRIPAEGSISYGELAKKVDAEESLIRRIGGVITSMGVLEQVGDDSVAHTKRSRIYIDGHPAGQIMDMAWENALVPYVHMPAYFEKYGRKEPQSLNHVPGTFAYGVPEYAWYEMLQHDPPRMQRFMRAMGPIEEKMPISGIYDFGWVVEHATKDAETDRVLFVDVGGGRGQSIRAIHRENPGLPLGRCVLEDRPEVIEVVEKLDDEDMRLVQKQVIDFHKEQPVKGALIYWIRRCLHNYGDEIGVNMLRIIAEAMADDSRLLIQEDVMGNPPHYTSTMLDFMMLSFGGKQRSLECWTDILGRAGLEIQSVSKGRGPWRHLAVIECVRARR